MSALLRPTFSKKALFGETSYDAIRLTALTHGDQVANTMNRSARVRMFTDACTIVDNVHVARQVLRALAYPTAAAVEFQTKYEMATELRNKMDHVVTQASNHSNRKDQPPLLGMISYCHDNLEQTDTGYAGRQLLDESIFDIKYARTATNGYNFFLWCC